MIIAPLLFATLVVGIAGHGDAKSLGKIGLKTIIYFEIVTTLALIIGLTTANIFKPGIGFVTSNSIHAIHMQKRGLWLQLRHIRRLVRWLQVFSQQVLLMRWHRVICCKS